MAHAARGVVAWSGGGLDGPERGRVVRRWPTRPGAWSREWGGWSRAGWPRSWWL